MPPMPARNQAPTLVAADFRAQHRGGGLFSEHISQRVGAQLALAAHRVGLSPTALTLTGLATGVGASVAMTVLTPRTAAGELPGWAVGLVVGLAWQLAYCLDCADGQLARVTGRTSAAGARLDILCDVAVQISLVTALVVSAEAHAPGTPAWLYALFAGTWMVNIVTSILATGPGGASLVRSRSALVRAGKLVRDYGAVVAVCTLVLALAPDRTGALMLGLSALNGGFLLASTAQAALASVARPDTGGRRDPRDAMADWRSHTNGKIHGTESD